MKFLVPVATAIVLLISAVAVAVAMAVDLQYPSSQPESELEKQPYDKMEFYIKGTGYISVYGETSEQEFTHPEFEDGDQESRIETFIARQLGFDRDAFDDGSARFRSDGADCYLKLSTDTTSYEYTLLRVTDCPEVISLPTDQEYVLKSGVSPFPRHDLIPLAAGFQVTGAKYYQYEEVEFYYDRGYKTHSGRNWKIDFARIDDDGISYRYITAHDYKRKLLGLGGILLADEDNSLVLQLGNSIAAFSSCDGTFSLNIVEEEAFEQTLVLTPDTIKTELDRTGQVTLDGVYFDFNEATLKPESRKAILSAVALMETYPDLVLAVQGYTDSSGDEDYNLRLSGERAASVATAIADGGIDSSRLQSRGFGESEPIATNETEDGRAENRRVELHKISGGEEKRPITIDFIKPLDGSVVESRYSYGNSSLDIQYAPPYADEKELVEYTGQLDVISYEIQHEGRKDSNISRTEIARNYRNVLELYNANIVNVSGSDIDFEIPDRGDGLRVFGRIEAYDGTYTIRFLVEEK